MRGHNSSPGKGLNQLFPFSLKLTGVLLFGLIATLLVLTFSLSWLAAQDEDAAVDFFENAGRRRSSSFLSTLEEAESNMLKSNANATDKVFRLPQFLIVGVQKCGTSALYFSLCLHPNVKCAAYYKEPFFLSMPMTANVLQR